MSIDYETEILPFEGELSDAEIADKYKNRTAKPIDCGDAKVLLESTRLVMESVDGDPAKPKRSGLLIDRYNNMADGDLKDLLGWFINHTFGRGKQISSNENPRDIQLAAVIADLPAGQLADAGAALIELGGGQPDKDADAAYIAQQRTKYQAAQAEALLAGERAAARRAIRQRAQNAIDAAATADVDGAAAADVTAAGEAAFNAS